MKWWVKALLKCTDDVCRWFCKVEIISLPKLGSVLKKKKKEGEQQLCRKRKMLIDHQKVRSSECGGSCVVGPSQSPSGDNQKIHNNRAPTFWWSEHLTIWESITLVWLFTSSRWYLIAAPIVPESMVAKNRSEVWRRVFGKRLGYLADEKRFSGFPDNRLREPFLFPASPRCPSLCVITILAPTPQHRDQVSAAEIWDEIKLRLK